MGVYDNVEGVARKSMVMFFLIDTSGSMEGRSIAGDIVKCCGLKFGSAKV